MQKDLVQSLDDGGYYEVHVNKDKTCRIPEIGKCLVEGGPFSWHIVKILEPPKAQKK
jgi:hypothetical protein